MRTIILRVSFAASLVIALSCRSITSLVPGTSGEAASVLLNEILFLPAQGQFQFVELKAVKSTSLDGLSLVNEYEQSYALPSGVRLAVDEVLLILFDGQNKVEGHTIHADRAEFLNPDSGFINLIASDGAVLDHVAWGTGQAGAVYLSRGGFVSKLPPGATIGRYPQSMAIDPWAWVPFSPAQATPGSPNPAPAVEVLLPYDGSLLDSSDVRLAWYTVPDALEYRLQIAVESTFSAPLVDQRVQAPGTNILTVATFIIDTLAPGEYVWRVQPIFSNSTEGDFSVPQSFILSNAGSTTTGSQLAAPAAASELPVPHFFQRKDTHLLVLESLEGRTWDTWDQPSPDDFPSGPYCVRAVVSMVNAYYHGSQKPKLSQDRIAYEMFKGYPPTPGPEGDLDPAHGPEAADVLDALVFALNAEVQLRYPDGISDIWQAVRTEIDAQRPFLANTSSHIVVIAGYKEEAGKRYVKVLDPARGVGWTPLDTMTGAGGWEGYWFLPPRENANPASDEESINSDSDGDGVKDFDEQVRFHTNPNHEDTDADKVKDKDDIRASVFDEQHGYATGHEEGRDFDGDGVAMELDEDSDGGHCSDGIEDLNLNGIFEQDQKETYNFEKGDDVCIWGTDETYYDIASYNDEIRTTTHLIWRLFATYSLRPLEDGTLTGSAQITYESSGENHDDTCPVSPITIDPPVIRWSAELAGTYERLLDGTVNLYFTATPDHSPPYSVVEDWCLGRIVVPSDGVPWIGMGGQLKDGVYDLHFDVPLLPSWTGEYWTTIHMEQAGNP